MAIRAGLLALFALFALSACAGAMRSGSEPTPVMASSDGEGAPRHIQHVVIVIHENRSFDNLFATFPGADGATTGKMSNGKRVPLKKVDFLYPHDLGHSYQAFLRDYNKGKMNGFDLEGGGKGQGPAGKEPYQYVDPTQIQPYWDIAQQYALADHLFQTQGSGSFTAHQDLIAGGTAIDETKSLIDFPSAKPWGCDAPQGTRTSIITTSLDYRYMRGPTPCVDYATLRDLLDEKSVSWKYYSPPVKGSTGSIWNAFDAIRAVRYGSEWGTNVTFNNNQIFDDIASGTLPAVSWFIPDLSDSDHPGIHGNTGPSAVADLVNTIGNSGYWKSTAIVVVWDDWGGFYDHEPPPFRDDAGGLGFRVPMLVVSPYTPRGLISHTQYEFGSILKFVENNWNLGRLGTSDVRATSMVDCFDFNQRPRRFVPITSQYSHAYFMRRPPSYQPVDTE
ncbi:MAG TPA: alkaline phosphatase family protein [Candidatus Baltobacteraceae bacterium]|jgi:phospholipase C|nr:alkaline phosphatase family protein [Candidatus Baltobacteraceae bacterium]